MNRVFISGVAVMLTAGVAAAADLPAKAPFGKAPIAIGYDWTGFYLGGYWGTSIGQSSVSTPGLGATPGSVDISKDSWTAGGTAGANWQVGPNWLVGVEGDLGYLANDRSFSQWNDPAVTAGVKTSWYSTVRGRLGYVTGPSLLYLTGGAAFVHVEDKFGGCAATFFCGTSAPAAVTTTKTGWTAGGGIETKLSRNWSQKTEYLYVDAGTTDFRANPFGATMNASFKNQFHLIKTGINYKFGGPAEPLPFFAGAMVPSDHNWAGLYIGGNVGGGLTTSRAPAVFPLLGENDLQGNGLAGGVQAGYNVMNLLGRPNWFAGVEADIGYLGIKASHRDWNDSVQMSQNTNWYSTVRGRLGTNTGPALLYVTGGAAFVSVKNDFTLIGAVAAPGSDARNQVKAGWTFGGGTEVALSTRWSAKLEYLYIDAGKSRQSFTSVEGGAPFVVFNDFSNRFHVVRAGLNYNFNAPLLAKY